MVGARSCPREMSVKFLDFAELRSLIDFKTLVAAVLTDFCQMVPVKSWKNTVWGSLKQKSSSYCMLPEALQLTVKAAHVECWLTLKNKNVSLRFYILFFHANSAKLFFLYRMVALSRGCKSPCQHIYVWDLSLTAKLRHPLDFWLTD